MPPAVGLAPDAGPTDWRVGEHYGLSGLEETLTTTKLRRVLEDINAAQLNSLRFTHIDRARGILTLSS